MLHPDWHQEQLPTYYWLQQQRAKGGCLHRHSWGAHCAAGSEPPPRVKELGIAGRIETEDNGFLVIKVRNAQRGAGYRWLDRDWRQQLGEASACMPGAGKEW